MGDTKVNITERFGFEIEHLGVVGVCDWLLASFGTRDSIPPSDKFLYNDDVGLLDVFRVVSKRLSPTGREILLNSMVDALDRGSQCSEPFFLFAVARLLEGLGCQSDCKPAYQRLEGRLTGFVSEFNFQANPTYRNLSDLADYRDALEFCLDSALDILRRCKTLNIDWIKLPDVNSHNSEKDDIVGSVMAIKPILEHAQHTLVQTDKIQEIRGLNVAYIPLMILSTLNAGLEEQTLIDVGRRIEPLIQKVKTGLKTTISPDHHEEIPMFENPGNSGEFGPYNLRNFDQKINAIIRALGVDSFTGDSKIDEERPHSAIGNKVPAALIKSTGASSPSV